MACLKAGVQVCFLFHLAIGHCWHLARGAIELSVKRIRDGQQTGRHVTGGGAWAGSQESRETIHSTRVLCTRVGAGKTLLTGLTHEVVRVFIGDMRDDRQRLLEMSRAGRERLSMALAREAGENSGDSDMEGGREWSMARESKRSKCENDQARRVGSWGGGGALSWWEREEA